MQKSHADRLRLIVSVLAGWTPVPDEAPVWVDLALPLWWCVLIVAAVTCGGYGVKFVYIDF
jgi:hypothetical protein